MRANLTPTVNLDFLDGYLFRLMQEILADQGVEGSGFYNYYESRVAQKLGGLVEYEEKIARYLLAGFKDRRVVHAGIGIGTMACALACSGMQVTGIESFNLRVESARRVRKALVEVWPEVEERYEIIEGTYPSALVGKNCFGRDVILVFTNVGAGWDEKALTSIIESMHQFGEVFLDLRLFGSVRDSDDDRAALFDRIAASARWAERLPHVAYGVHLARFAFKGGRPN